MNKLVIFKKTPSKKYGKKTSHRKKIRNNHNTQKFYKILVILYINNNGRVVLRIITPVYYLSSRR